MKLKTITTHEMINVGINNVATSFLVWQNNKLKLKNLIEHLINLQKFVLTWKIEKTEEEEELENLKPPTLEWSADCCFSLPPQWLSEKERPKKLIEF